MISVLYVDDEPSLVEIGKLFLERTGNFSVKTQTSAKDALTDLATQPFDCIVSDYQMPEMDGIVLLQAIRSRHNTIPFILFTGKGREEVVIDAINNGADFYLQKGGDPVAQFAELAHKIRQSVERRRAEKALLKSRDELKQYMDIAGVMFVVLDNQGIVQLINQTGCRILQRSQNEIVGKNWFSEFIPARVKEETRALISRIWNGDTNIGKYHENRVVCPDGSERLIAWHNTPLKDDHGTIIGILSSGQDITKWKENEQKMLNSLTFLNNLIDQSPVPTLITDMDGNLIRINDTCCTLLNIKREDVVGKYNIFHDNFVEEQGYIPLVHSAFSKGRIIHFPLAWQASGLKNFTFGKSPHVILDVTIFPIRDSQGLLTNMVVQHIDITEQTRAEKSLKKRNSDLEAAFEELRHNYEELTRNETTLQESESKFQALFETMTQGVVYFNRDGRITSVNPAAERILGISFDQMIHRCCPEAVQMAVHEDKTPYSYDTRPAVQALKTGREIREVMRVFNPEQEKYIWLLAHAIPLFQPGEDRPHEVCTTFEDITHLKKDWDAIQEN
jgi:PAS domain S-box-containing protein